MIDPVPLELARLIAAEAAAPVGDAHARVAIRARVTSSAAAPAAGKLVALLLGIAVVGAVAVIAVPRAHTGGSTATTSSAPVVLPPLPPPPPTAPPPTAIAAPPAPATRTTAVRIAPKAPPRSAPAPLQRPPSEGSLLAQASRALATGAAARALELVSEHARLYPSGQLAEERDALHVRALVAAGRDRDARAAAAQFVAAHPHSIYQPSLAKELTP